MKVLTAEYFSHETRGIETVTQEFDGDKDFIAREYFEIYGDRLVRLSKDGVTIWEEKGEKS